MIPSVLLTALKELGQHIGKKLDAVKTAVDKLTKGFDDLDISRSLAPLFTRLGDRLENAFAKERKIQVQTSVDLDTTQLEELIEDVKGSFQAPELAPIQALLIKQTEAIDRGAQAQTTALASGFASLLTAVRAIKTGGDKLKFDDMQMRAITSLGRGGGGSAFATKTRLKNLDMPTADEEYEYTFPANTLAWTIRVRETDVPLLYAFETGKLPISGDGTAYATVPAYYLNSQSGVEWSGKTIYLQTGSSSQKAEIISYQM